MMVDQDEGDYDLPLRHRPPPAAASQDLILEFQPESERPSIFTIEVAPPIAPASEQPAPSPASSVNRWDVWRAPMRRLFGRISAACVATANSASRLLVSAGARVTSAAHLLRPTPPSTFSVNRWDVWRARMRRLSGRISAARVAAAESASRRLVSAGARVTSAAHMLRPTPPSTFSVNRRDVWRARMRQFAQRTSAAKAVGAENASRLLASAKARFTSVALAVRVPDRGYRGHVTGTRWLAIARRHAALIAVIAVPLVVKLIGPASQSPQGSREMSVGVGLPTLAAGALPREQWPMAASPVVPGESPSMRLRPPASAGQSLSTSKPAPGGQLAASPRPVDPFLDDRRAIQTVLSSYRDALSTLDVHAVAAVWPTADIATLQRQFARIDDQNLEYEQCGISVGNAKATATCSGVIESGFRAGQRRLHSARTQWRFTLEKKSKRWLIRTVATERSGGTSAATNLATVRSPE
jgi:hypothetical protein